MNRLIQRAELEQPDASIATVDYRHGRKINRKLIERLASTSLNIETSSSPAQQEVRDRGRFKDVLKKYTNPVLLILDEWLLIPLSEKDSANLLELIHKRRKHSSTIFCSQYWEEDWYENMGGKDNPLTDAIMDRIAFDSYKIPIKSIDPEKDISMREVYGLDPSLAQ